MNTAQYEAVLREVRASSGRVKHFRFQVESGGTFCFTPGQFLSLQVQYRGKNCTRDYSIASAPRPENSFDLCLNLVPHGFVTQWLFQLKPGDSVRFEGPFGLFTLRQPVDPVSVFIATGTGISPIRAMLQQLRAETCPGEVWLIFGVRTEADILYREEFEEAAKENPKFHFVPILSRPGKGWAGPRGYVQTQIKKYLENQQGFHAYVCGLKKMVYEVRHQLVSMGYPPGAISYEKYD